MPTFLVHVIKAQDSGGDCTMKENVLELDEVGSFKGETIITL